MKRLFAVLAFAWVIFAGWSQEQWKAGAQERPLAIKDISTPGPITFIASSHNGPRFTIQLPQQTDKLTKPEKGWRIEDQDWSKLFSAEAKWDFEIDDKSYHLTGSELADAVKKAKNSK